MGDQDRDRRFRYRLFVAVLPAPAAVRQAEARPVVHPRCRGATRRTRRSRGRSSRMANSLGLTVVAEGVETAPQLEFLDALGCTIMQGFLLGRPVDRCGDRRNAARAARSPVSVTLPPRSSTIEIGAACRRRRAAAARRPAPATDARPRQLPRGASRRGRRWRAGVRRYASPARHGRRGRAASVIARHRPDETRRILLHALRAHGAQQIFGIPGDFALPFFKVIEESGDPAALHAVARAGGRVRRRRRGAGELRARRRRGHLWRRRAQHGQRGRRRLRRAVAGGRDLRARPARARRAPGCCCTTRPRRWTRSSGSTARSPASRCASTTRRARPGASRACSRAAAANRARSTSSCRATWSASAPRRWRRCQPSPSTPTRSRPASTRSWRGSPRRGRRC